MNRSVAGKPGRRAAKSYVSKSMGTGSSHWQAKLREIHVIQTWQELTEKHRNVLYQVQA